MPFDQAMPLDEGERRVFQALKDPLGRFRSALATAIEELREAHDLDEREANDGQAVREAGLGAFAAGRIDPERFGALARRDRAVLEPKALPRLDGAFHALSELAARREQLHRVNVESGKSLHHAVQRTMTEVGRAFGAARIAALARSGGYREEEHAAWLGGFPFALWNRAERRLAPPLVVEVDGADLGAECLAEFLDGTTKIVLLVRGAAPPAPLARLVSPGVFVAQVTSPDELAAFAAFAGPGIVALVPEGAARFVHDPAAGVTLGERLRIDAMPERAPDRPLGPTSVFQQTEGLRQLAALVERAAPSVVGAAGPADTAGKLAAWLLGQADLGGLEAGKGG